MRKEKNLRVYIYLLLVSLILPQGVLRAQTGGDNTYEFLSLPWSARASALGGTIVSYHDEEPSLAFCNPSSASANMHGMLSLGYTSYLAGISFGSAGYTFGRGMINTFTAGINWLNYGGFTGSDNSGNITGSFRAAEYALNLIYTRTIDSVISVGVAIKPVLSHLESYTSVGMAADIGATFTSRNKLLSAGVTVRNAGFQFKSYAGEEREKLPFEIQAGISGKLAHAPLRFTLTMRNLQKYDLTHRYDTASVTGGASDGFGENLLRHCLFGAEFLPHRNFWIGAGYNYQRRTELRVEEGGAAAGFSWGFGANIGGFRVVFSRATYHLAGGASNFSLAFNPGSLYRKITD